MKQKTIGVNLQLTNTILEVPATRVYELQSLYLAGTSPDEVGASVYITKAGSPDKFYLVKNALIAPQSTYQIVSKAVFMLPGDTLFSESSDSNVVDLYLSYLDKYKYD